eukprot:6464168-Amphidinium_carterae.2
MLEYDPMRPWNYIWTEVAKDAQWWHRKLEVPCLLFLTRTNSLESMVTGEAPVKSSTPKGLSRSGALPKQIKKPREQYERQHVVGKDGHYTSNRRGVELCRGWQDGGCTYTVNGNKCGRNTSRAHQCARCLSTDHGASSCKHSSSPSAPSQPPAVKYGPKPAKGDN